MSGDSPRQSKIRWDLSCIESKWSRSESPARWSVCLALLPEKDPANQSFGPGTCSEAI
jgi:hypothetical protein